MSSTEPGSSASSLLSRSVNGEPGAVEDLRRLLLVGLRSEAARYTGSLDGSATLDTSALAGEILRANPCEDVTDFRCRARLLWMISTALFELLVDHAREYRDEQAEAASTTDASGIPAYPPIGRVHFDDRTTRTLLDLDAALTALQDLHPRWVDIVHCIVFGRMSFAETATALDVSPRTVRTDWILARVWIHRFIGEADDPPGTHRAPP